MTPFAKCRSTPALRAKCTGTTVACLLHAAQSYLRS